MPKLLEVLEEHHANDVIVIDLVWLRSELRSGLVELIDSGSDCLRTSFEMITNLTM